jgi:asparagine synthase (glutamine-hydrolysing)
MCGLFGVFFFDRTQQPERERALRSVHSLDHRGPDAQGMHLAEGIVLGHTRLSFLDLSPEGNQPLWDSQRRYALIYNGEIYNFRELRAGLRERGYSFRTESDTEVLLYGLIDAGPAFLRDADGMFAFALYDRVEHSLLVGRDRFGIKPLYVAHRPDGLVFSSELKALRDWIDFRANERMLAAYLGGFDLPTAGATFLQGVDFFPTGASGRVTAERRTLEPQPFFPVEEFWQPDLRNELARRPVRKLIDRFDELLAESVRLHMIADVPVGALCSGGVDSSLILALATKHSSSLAIFHANVLGKHSEFPAAQTLAKHLRLDLVSVEVRDSDFLEQMPDVISNLEFPFLYHPNSIPFLQVTRLVQSRGTKAVLTGEGADEILLGYADIPLRGLIRRYHRAIDAVRSVVHRIPWVGNILWRTPAGAEPPLGKLIVGGFEEDALPEFAAAALDSGDAETQRIAFQLLGYHLRTLLMRNDRLGMAASIEARFPYLEHELVRFAVNLPRSLKIRTSTSAIDEIRHPLISTKWILRQVAARYLPRELAFRVKRGFPTGAFDRIRIDTKYFNDSWLASHYRLDRRGLAQMHRSASRHDLLRLLMLDAWGRIVLEQEPREAVRARLRPCIQFDAP